MSDRFIKLYGAMTDWCWYRSVNEKVLFLHCLLKAYWKDVKVGLEVIPRGSFVTSLATLSEETGLSIQEIRTALKHLETTGEISQKSTNKQRTIKVEKYEDFQCDTRQLTSKQQTANNIHRILEEENNRDIDNIYISNKLSPPYIDNIYNTPHGGVGEGLGIPTLLEVETLIEERGYHFSAEEFWNYYNSQGWKKSNGVELKDWKSACYTWEKKRAGGKVW